MDQIREAPANQFDIPPHERLALDARRDQAGLDRQGPRIGLALSGGGVRSATFCLGLLRALAKNGVLHRFDYLSTVSGGGYIGAAFGRLFNTNTTPEQVEQGVARNGSLFMWWLRSNGRYLSPAGSRDLLQTWVGQLRGFVATQFEIATLIGLLACIIVLPHVACHQLYNEHLPLLTSSIWWSALPVIGWFAITIAFAYWWSRDPEDGSLARDLVICACTLAAAVYLLRHVPVMDPDTGVQHAGLMVATAALLLAIPAAWVWTRLRSTNPARDRIRYTVALATILKYFVLLLVLGAADLAGWYLAYLTQIGLLHFPILSGAGVTVFVVTLARFALRFLQPRGNSKPGVVKLPLTLIANLCGLLLIVLLVLFWLSALQFFLFFASASNSTAHAWSAWLIIMLPCLGYVCLTGINLQQINRSSLHAFYRSRLARTYVSVGNNPTGDVTGATRFPISPLLPRNPGMVSSVEKVTQLLDGDDVELPGYAPHQHGGPIHLINCCINQTIDDRTDAYNADRKGICLTVSALGVETGTQLSQPATADGSLALQGTTLAEWIAISGAAAGSGMGSLTRPGIAALTFLSGFRLGYWWRNHQGGKSFWWRYLGKSRAALQEMLARFPGLQSPVWYLSDGGHFDNTGVYTLLKRELKLIVLADCGADPNYIFTDVESLVRKARIDFGATIEFIDPASLPTTAIDDAVLERFGTPDSVMPGAGQQHLLLARIRYRRGNSGALLVVKPRQPCVSPLDVAGYSNRDASFPQQTTADQFFDEAQWESYCELGELLGHPIDAVLLDELHDLALAGTPTVISVIAPETAKAAMTLRQRVTATVGASLGLSALIGFLLAGWQTWDSHLKQSGDQLKQITDATRSLARSIDRRPTFDSSVDSAVQLFTSEAGRPPYPEAIQPMVHSLTESLKSKCAELLPPDKLAIACNNDLTILGTEQSLTGWDKAMIDYRDWPPKVELDPGAMAIEVASQSIPSPSASSSPLPPPAVATASSAAPEATVTSTMSGLKVSTKAAHASGSRITIVPSVDTLAARAREACTYGVSRRFIVYTQIYDEAERGRAEALLPQLRSLGLATPGIENVTVSASTEGRTLPFQWRAPTVLYSATGEACSAALTAWLEAGRYFPTAAPQAVPFPLSIRGAPNVIELWIPHPIGLR